MFFFPFRLNANTANTHHQALGGCRAKGSGDLEVEALQQSSLMVFTEGKKPHIRDPYCAGFLKLMGPKTFVISLRTNIFRDSFSRCLQSHLLYKTVIRFRDSSSSPWVERRGRSSICLVVIKSTFRRALIIAPAALNIRHPFV